MISQYNKGKQGNVAEYNANNAWLYNGNNGCLNNNNKNNTNSVRPTLDSHYVKGSLKGAVVPLAAWYPVYRTCRRHCGRKHLHLRFRYGWMVLRLINTAADVAMFEYIPGMAVCFMIERPRLREIIAAMFDDKMVQTLFCSAVMPMLEAKVLDDDSYACRKGKGGLRAVLTFQEYVFEESCGYTRDVWLAKRDIRGFFMSIDTNIGTSELCAFIQENTQPGPMRDMLLYLARVIYQSLPQMHCRVQSPESLHQALPEYKRMRGKASFKGVAIGNMTSQMMAAFYVTRYLFVLRAKGYRFVHYTDDTAIVVRDRSRWLDDQRWLAAWMKKELALELHPDKVYLQHYSKGIEMLGYKLRFNRILPSDRIVHNFRWRVRCMGRKANGNRAYMFANVEHFMQSANSYLGLLGWCNTERLRAEIVEDMKADGFGRLLSFPDGNRKTNIKPPYTRAAHYKRLNKKRKKSLKLWICKA